MSLESKIMNIPISVGKQVDAINEATEPPITGLDTIAIKASESPTHEEIMTKWWLTEEGGDWARVNFYYSGGVKPYIFMFSDINDKVVMTARGRDWFLNRQSADIPPEV